MNRGFKYHEHTADITIECWAPALEGAFEEAALATLEVIMDTSTVTPTKSIDINCKGIDLQELLVEWIGRIIALIDIEHSFFSEFEVNKISKTSNGFELIGEVRGEEIDLEKHKTCTEVKAMTYADLEIDEKPERTTIWFTLDL